MLLNCLLAWLVFVWLFSADEAMADGLAYRTECCWKTNAHVPDVYKTTADFIEALGYIAEIHMVTTEDGYINKLHRMAGKQSDSANNEIGQSNRPAVLIQHGIGGRSDNWILNKEKSFPYLLAEAGYDVWLSDTRGNGYSKDHVSLTSEDPKYWDFSFHEQGLYDMRAATDYVISTSGQPKIFYVGHSRGTTMALVLLSLRPEYNEKFHLVVLFSPVAYLKYALSPIMKTFFLKSYSPELMHLARYFRMLTFPGLTGQNVEFRKHFCSLLSPTQHICVKLLFLLIGFDYELYDASRTPTYATHFPDGGGLKEYLHFIQNYQADEFRQFDYGAQNNMEIYGRPEPPKYELNKITAPLALFYANNDFILSINDYRRLSSQLKSKVVEYEVPFKKFNHMDFLWATKADNLVYKPTIMLMNRYRG